MRRPGAPHRGCVRAAIASALALAFLALTACDAEPPVAEGATSSGGGSPAADGSDAAPGAVPESNRLMSERLATIATVITPDSIRYRNNERVTMLLRQRDAGGAASDVQLEMVLAVELMRAGRSEEAIEQLARVEKLFETHGIAITPDNRHTLDRLAAISWLRLGEQENCIENHSIDSCLLPIRGEGVHRIERGSRNAVALYEKLLEGDPDDVAFRWLLNIGYMTLGEWPDGVPERWSIPEETFASEYELPRFRDVAMATGVAHTALSGGTVIDDFNGDGNLDIVVTSWGVHDPMAYFESDGRGAFIDRTQAAGLAGMTGGLNAVQADYDNDGWVDLLVLRGAWLGGAGEYPDSLLRNLGDGRFEDVTERAGLLRFHPTHSAAWGDYDNDGWLDLFVGYESRGTPRPCALFRNNGDGTFTDVAREVGLDHVGFVKGVVWGDYDNDGRPDLYLSRMAQPNVLYRNEGPGADGTWKFRDVTAKAGVANPVKSFPTWFFDYDNDGWLDLLVASFSDFGSVALESVAADYLGLPTDATRTVLYRNRGDGTFEDVSRRMNVDRVMLAMGANFGDLDNDGWLDMYFGTGEPAFYTLVPNVMLRNDEGRRFQDVTTAGGFGSIQKGHGIAFADIDNDGDQDIYANMGGAYSGDIYQNVLFENPGNDHRWVTLRLEGTRSNRSAIGARVRVVVNNEDGSTRDIHRVVGSGGSFGASSLQLEVGLGRASSIDRIEVRWPSEGDIAVYRNVPLDRIVRVREGETDAVPVEQPRIRMGSGLTFQHQHAHSE